VKGKSDYSALAFAADMGRIDCCKKLVGLGADLQTRVRGLTVLHLNSANGHLDCLKYFLDQGMDPSQKNEKDQNPLFYASRNGHNDVVALLITRPGVTGNYHPLRISQLAQPK
jgi:ankyrin repeat protein